MFFEIFAASALATVLFSGNTNSKDYSGEFYGLNRKLDDLDDKVNSKLDKIIDTQAFMRARSCLENFSPLLLEGISLSYKHHTIQDIMEAAQEGFDVLCKTAVADENNFKEARKIFADTWGNVEWVNAKFGNEIDEWTETIEKCEREYASLKPVFDDLSKKASDIFYETTQNTPVKKRFFKTVVDEKKTKELIKMLYDTFNSAPEMSPELVAYLTECDDKSLEISIDSNKIKSMSEDRFRHFTNQIMSGEILKYRNDKLVVDVIYKSYFEGKDWLTAYMECMHIH